MSNEAFVGLPRVLAAFNGRVFALGAHGERVWTFKLQRESAIRLAPQGERVFVLGFGLACLDYRTGRLLWRVDVESYFARGSLLADGDVVFIAGAGKVAAHDAATGRQLWEQPFKGEGSGAVALAVRDVAVQGDIGQGD